MIIPQSNCFKELIISLLWRKGGQGGLEISRQEHDTLRGSINSRSSSVNVWNDILAYSGVVGSKLCLNSALDEGLDFGVV
jgi:hypothetical protein